MRAQINRDCLNRVITEHCAVLDAIAAANSVAANALMALHIGWMLDEFVALKNPDCDYRFDGRDTGGRYERRHRHPPLRSPDMASKFETQDLREHIPIKDPSVPEQVRMSYSHIDRLVVAGTLPAAEPNTLPTAQSHWSDAL